MGFSETGSVADAVVAWTQELSRGIAGSGDCAIHRWSAALMAVVDGRCAGVFEEVHPVVILNFG